MGSGPDRLLTWAIALKVEQVDGLGAHTQPQQRRSSHAHQCSSGTVCAWQHHGPLQQQLHPWQQGASCVQLMQPCLEGEQQISSVQREDEPRLGNSKNCRRVNWHPLTPPK